MFPPLQRAERRVAASSGGSAAPQAETGRAAANPKSFCGVCPARLNCISRLAGREGIQSSFSGFVAGIESRLTLAVVTVVPVQSVLVKSVTSTVGFTWSEVNHTWSCEHFLTSVTPAPGSGLWF